MRLKEHPNTTKDYLRAKTLRNEASPDERLFWKALRESAVVHGLKFRRQHVVHPYFADFACLSARVIVELDGESHNGSVAYDRQRDSFLRSQGYDVLRFSNDEVRTNLEGVVATILSFSCSKQQATPSPANSKTCLRKPKRLHPLPQGERIEAGK